MVKNDLHTYIKKLTFFLLLGAMPWTISTANEHNLNLLTDPNIQIKWLQDMRACIPTNIKLITNTPMPVGLQAVETICTGNNSKVIVSVFITRRIQAARLTRDLPAGASIGEADYEYADVWVNTKANWPLSAQTIKNFSAKKALSSDTILTAHMLTPSKAWARGDPVQVRSKAGSIIVSVQAIALRDATVGQKTQVKNAERILTGIATKDESGYYLELMR